MSESMQFKTEVQQLLQLMIHSVYSNKEIFLRELVANAADAIDKARFESLTRQELAQEWAIRLETDEEAMTLCISDNGIGMTKDEVISDIGTIARSGTKAFLESIKAAQEKSPSSSPELIGQFGVGFYSAFMVADKVELDTKKAGSDSPAVHWESDGKESFSISESSKTDPGTTVRLHIKKDAKDYLDYWRLEGIVRKYSDFIEHPVKMRHMVKRDGKDVEEDSTLNSRKAIWLRPESEVSEEEYKQFYSHLAHFAPDPLKRISFSAEGKSEFKALLYIPSKAPFDFLMPPDKGASKGVHLYVRRVFITDNCPGLMPEYLRFVKGVVDSSDLPLNISREMLQDNPEIQRMNKNVSRRVLSELKGVMEKERASYESFYKEFSRPIKEGVHSDLQNKEKLQELLLFETMKSAKGALLSLKEYCDAMPATQKEIYYLIGESREALENSPHLECVRSQGFDAIFMTDPIDEWVVESIREYSGKPMKSLAKGAMKLDESARKAMDEKTKKASKDSKGLIEFLKSSLSDKIKDVRFSAGLTESPCRLVGEEHEPDAYMQRILKAMNRESPDIKRIMELNPGHPLVSGMERLRAKSPDSPKLAEYAAMLYDQALLAEGSPLPDPTLFAKRAASLMVVGIEREL